MLKKSLFSIVCGLFLLTAVQAEPIDPISGVYGSVNYLITGEPNNLTLAIWGNGAMPEHEDAWNRPWFDMGNGDLRASIKHITVAEGVLNIGGYAFEACGLTSIVLPNSVSTIGNNAFHNCGDMTSITLPNTLTSIGDYAFWWTGLISVTVPESVTSLGTWAFAHCKQLISITLPSTMTVLPDYFLCWSDALPSITLPASLTAIGEAALQGLMSLTSLEIPAGVISLGFGALAESGYSTLTLPEGIDTIPNQCFYHCVNLTSLEIPESVVFIGNVAFCHCESLTQLTFKSITPPTFDEDWICEYDEGATNPTITVPCDALTDYQNAIPDYTLIPDNNCTGIESVNALEWHIYPNPVKNELFLSGDFPVTKAEIYNITGALLLSEININGKINLSALLPGSYMLMIYTDNSVAVKKVVKE